MKALVCTQCGGKVNPAKMRCEYCGTHYEQNIDLTKPLRITYGPHAQVLKCSLAAPSEFINSLTDAEEVSRMIHSEITRRMAEALEPYVDYEIQEDPTLHMQVVRGRVRVLPPGYNFD